MGCGRGAPGVSSQGKLGRGGRAAGVGLDIVREKSRLLLSGAQGCVRRSAFLETSLYLFSFVCLFLLRPTAIGAVKRTGNLLTLLFN